MRRVSATVCGLLLLTACSHGDFVPSPPAHTLHATPLRAPRRVSKTGLVDPAALRDFGIALADTGVDDVVGHSFVLTPPEQVSWSRRPSQWEGPDGRRGDGTWFLTDGEHAELERLVDDLWRLAAVGRELDETSERASERTWAIAMKRNGEVRVLEGHGWPGEASSVFTFVNARIDARVQQERDRGEAARQERSCDPPFFIDAAGHKFYKERCL